LPSIGASEPSGALPDDECKQLPAPQTPVFETAEADRKAVKTAVEAAWGGTVEPDDAVCFDLLQTAAKQGVPTRALCCWIVDFARMKQSAGYTIESPRLFAHAAKSVLPAWCRSHLTLVDAAAGDERRAQTVELQYRVNLMFESLKSWQKLLLPGRGAPVEEISPDNPQHLDALIEIANLLPADTDMLRFSLAVSAKLKGLDQHSLAKQPGRAPGAPEGPRIFSLLTEIAREFARTGGAR
jgi:hypothetical protein